MNTTEKRLLRYDFTAIEVHELSMALAGKNKEIVTLKKQKSSVVSEYTAKINAAEASCNDLSNKVADGYEHRDVGCEVIFNQPDNGKKTIIRKDSNMLVGVEAMTQQDWNKINEENTLFGKEGDENLLAEANTQEV